MLSDEENQAIKECDNIFMCLDDAMSEDSANDYRKSYKILKNLIEKQSKEIEELKEKNEYLPNWVNKKYVSKAKIKAKIEEIIERLEAKPYTAYTLYGDILYESDEIVQMLQSLLEDKG